MRRNFNRHLLTVSLASLAVSLPSMAHAQEAQAAAQTTQFSIPAQSLDAALRSFSDQADADVLYPPELVANKTSAPVTGAMTPAAALKQLLEGTGVLYNQVSLNNFALRSGQVTYRGDPAATSAVSGTIIDASSGGTLPGARVSIVGSSAEAVSDARGFFSIPDVPASASRLTVAYIGQPSETVDLPVGANARRRLVVELGKSNQEIVVNAFLSSTQKALNQQLNAPNNSTIISADLLGSFPAETVSDALRRVPGVAFGRDVSTGEGSRVTVRGISSEAINIQLNGVDLQGTGFERTIDLSDFLTDNIAQITVHKSLLPSQQATASGGFVQIETKTGLDYGDFAFNFGIEGETNFDRKFGEEYQVNATIAKKLTPDFGVSATVQYRKTNRLNYSADIAGTIPPVLPAGQIFSFRVPASNQFPFDDELNTRLISGVSYSRRTRDEEDLTASLNFAWDVSSSTRLRLDIQRIQGNVSNQTSRNTASFLTTGVDMPIEELGGEVRRRTTLSRFRPNLNYNLTEVDSYSDVISFRGETTLDRWELKYKAGYSRARSKSNNQNMNLGAAIFTNIEDIINPDTAVINLDDDAAMTPRYVDGGAVFTDAGLPVLSLSDFGTALLNDPNTYTVTSAGLTSTNSPTEAWTFEGSARYLPPADWLSYIEVGGRYDSSDRKSQDDLFASTSVGSLSSTESYLRVFGTATDTTASFFGSDILSDATLGDIGAPEFAFPFLSQSSFNTIYGQLGGLLVDDPATAFNEARFRFTDNTADPDPITNSGAQTPTSTTEERFGAYFEAMLEVGDFDLITGVRMEHFKRSGTSLTTPSVRTEDNLVIDRSVFIANGLVNFVTLEGTGTTYTPVAILNYRPTDNLVARLSYNRTTVNPSFQQLRRARQVFIDLRPAFNRVTLREANPDLRPTVADNFEFDVSYYFTDSPGLVRAGFFYKNITDNFTDVNFADAGDGTVEAEIIEFFGELGVARPELIGFNDGTEFLRNRPENGEGGSIYGFEAEIIRQLTFLPGFLKDFGVLGNITYTTADFPRLVNGRNDDGTLGQFSLDRPLNDQSKWVYNASLNYAKDGFESRLIYTYQSASIQTENIFGIDTVVPSFATLDLRMSYTFDQMGGNWTVYLQGDDLLRGSKDVDEVGAFSSEFNGGTTDFYFPDTYLFGGGRSITAGIRARF